MLYASDYFEQLYEFAVELIRKRQGVRRQPDRRRDPRVPRHAHRAGQEQPVSRPQRSTRTSTSSRACAPASSRTARTCCARRSTWRRRTSTCAIRCSTASGTPRITAPATRGASIRCTTTRTRCRTAIEGITHSICTLEFEDHRPLYDWVRRAPRSKATTAAADRVRAAQPQLHGDEQAQAAAARAAGARHRLGRSADADASAACAGAATRRRRSASSATRIGVAKKENVIDVAQLEHCVREDLNRRAPRVMARAPPAEGRDRRTIRKGRSRSSTSSTIRRMPRRARARCRSRASSTSSATTFMEDPPKKFFRLSPGQGSAPALRLLHHVHGRGQGRARRDRRAALHLRSRRRAAAMRPTAGR